MEAEVLWITVLAACALVFLAVVAREQVRWQERRSRSPQLRFEKLTKQA
jgi:hypothetical protein